MTCSLSLRLGVARQVGEGMSNQKPPLTFEFTKRKRWGDLLITELADCILFVLSPTCNIWFCGQAVTDLLGWKDSELVDHNLLNLVYGMLHLARSDHLVFITSADEDQTLFKSCFDDSIRTKTDLFVHARLKNKNSSNALVTQPILYELKGRPYFLQENDQNCACMFAAARLYHSRNTDMYVRLRLSQLALLIVIQRLNGWLDLNIERERLQQRIRDLKNEIKKSNTSSTAITPPISQSYNFMGQTRMQGSSSLVPTAQVNYFASDLQTNSRINGFENSGASSANIYGSSPALSVSTDEDSLDDGSKKKKVREKKSFHSDLLLRHFTLD